MPVCIAEGLQTFLAPSGRISVKSQLAIGQPGAVAGQPLTGNRRKPDVGKQLTAHTTWLKVNERGSADVESESLPAKETSAATWLPVRFTDDGGQAQCLQSGGRRHSSDAAAHNGYVVHRLAL